MSQKSIYTKVQCDECGGTGYITVTTLAALRKKAGLNQIEVAEQLGLTRTSISNIERGVQAITLDKIKPMADLYNIPEYEMYDIAKAVGLVSSLVNQGGQESE